MQGILSGCRACFPLIMMLIFFISFISFLFWLSKKSPAAFKSAIITTIVVIFFIFAGQRLIFPRFSRIFFPSNRSKQAVEEWMIYDTDPRNDTFIKGRLDYRGLKKLDAVLMKEKANDGMMFDNITLNEVAKYDPQIIDAYYRWRKCKDMRRSYHKSIYPDERELYRHLR